MFRLVFFGDSISYGELVSPHKIWVSKCSSSLTSTFSDIELVVSNGSINGNTTRMALERIHQDVQQYKPDIVVIQFGLNDANFWKTDMGHPRVGPLAFEANLIEIIERCRLNGAKEIIIQTNHLTDIGGPLEAKCSPNAPTSYRENVKRYNHIIRSVAITQKVILNDIEKVWEETVRVENSKHGLLVEDGIHLSNKGHELYFNAVYPIVEFRIKNILER